MLASSSFGHLSHIIAFCSRFLLQSFNSVFSKLYSASDQPVKIAFACAANSSNFSDLFVDITLYFGSAKGSKFLKRLWSEMKRKFRTLIRGKEAYWFVRIEFLQKASVEFYDVIITSKAVFKVYVYFTVFILVFREQCFYNSTVEKPIPCRKLLSRKNKFGSFRFLLWR